MGGKMKGGRTRKEVRETLLAMLNAGIIKLPDADFERDREPGKANTGYGKFVRTICLNFDVLDTLEDLVLEYYKEREFPWGVSLFSHTMLSEAFDIEREIRNEDSYSCHNDQTKCSPEE